jgi:hypothetical protein
MIQLFSAKIQVQITSNPMIVVLVYQISLNLLGMRENRYHKNDPNYVLSRYQLYVLNVIIKNHQ